MWRWIDKIGTGITKVQKFFKFMDALNQGLQAFKEAWDGVNKEKEVNDVES
ncbi:hypothetical protein KEM09_12100 [Carboxylicivirga mesophila]|uniref:Uncharacterized protein n=1 Tax=Carboxylicivirga mesophila TaxID=1166478 RepID=A0ABS5KBE7_9BACT|nr:hypothetical protein [Carboxylicivirga mesophila]MBS2212152.1 hypothetical protein [Carboxylicivirga mesophila]